MARRLPAGIPLHYNGNCHDSDGTQFWLISGRMEVLSAHQARMALDMLRGRGETVTEVWADTLPTGGFLLNCR